MVRTNCVDCLDRTNTAQYVVAKAALGLQVLRWIPFYFQNFWHDNKLKKIFVWKHSSVYNLALPSGLLVYPKYWLWLRLLSYVRKYVRRSWRYPCPSIRRIPANTQVNHMSFRRTCRCKNIFHNYWNYNLDVILSSFRQF